MEYVTAAVILHEAGAEINQQNLSRVLESTGTDVSESQIKALVAALEDVDLDEIKHQRREQAAVPAGGSSEVDDRGATGAEDGGEAEATEADESEFSVLAEMDAAGGAEDESPDPVPPGEDDPDPATDEGVESGASEGS